MDGLIGLMNVVGQKVAPVGADPNQAPAATQVMVPTNAQIPASAAQSAAKGVGAFGQAQSKILQDNPLDSAPAAPHYAQANLAQTASPYGQLPNLSYLMHGGYYGG